jgi:SNF2 family DNA or RNA helicase
MHYKIQPWKHQLDAIERFKSLPYGALFFEQGCGKSLTLVSILRHKYEAQGFVVPTLVLCPAIVVENWRREWLMHSDLKDYQVVTLTGTGAERLEQFRLVAVDPHKVVITNYEALLMKGLHEVLKKWAKALILDESHKCKDITAKRTKLVHEISKNCAYRFIGSGTPVVNSLFDIYSQFLIMDQGKTFGEKFQHFKHKYFDDVNKNRPRHCYFPEWRPKPGAVREINANIYQSAVRVKKSECLDLPPLVRQVVDFELEDHQGRFYRAMETDAVAYFKDDVVSADLAIKKALRLQQITSGFVTDDTGATQIFEKNPRTRVLREVIEGIPPAAKIIIWAVFKQNYHDIRATLEAMEIPYTELHGEVDAGDRQTNVDSFNRPNGGPRVLIGHPGSGGIGVNLTAASYAIFYTRGFSLENDLQAEARNHRGGSEIHKCITRIDIVARHTIDEVVMCALRDKLDVSEAVLNHMRKGKI